MLHQTKQTHLKTKWGIVLIYQFIRKMFGLEVEESEHYNAIIFFIYISNYIFTDANFRIIPHPFKLIKTSIKIKIHSEYKNSESKGKLSKHLKHSFDLGF